MMKFVFVLTLLAGACYAQTPSCGSIHPVSGTAGSSVLSKTKVTNPTQANPQVAAVNGVTLFGIYIPYTCVTNGIGYIVATTTGTSNYGFGLVCVSGCSPAGGLVAQTGPVSTTTLGAVGGQHLGWAGGAVTLPPGVYGLAVASDCVSSCVVLRGDADYGAFFAFIAPDTSANFPWKFDTTSGISCNQTPSCTPPTVGPPVNVLNGPEPGTVTSRLSTTPNIILF